jgi:SAM-dependent methyltransferase
MPLARSERLELLDTDAALAPARELAGNLRDIRRVNRYLGGTRAVLRVVQPALRHVPIGQYVEILDLATGSADIPLAIVRQARRAGRRVRIVATDFQPSVLAVARAADLPAEVELAEADARALPYADRSFDLVILSLALHHFDPEEGRRVLAEMRRVGRRMLIVNDLERCRLGYAGAWLMGHLLTRNRLTRHDAPLSVRRAYTPTEALALAHAAGWRRAHARRVRPFRFVLTGVP